MPHPFDAASKQLIRLQPADYLALAGLPAGTSLEFVDTDLSVVSSAADQMIRVNGPNPYLAHIEFQTGPRPELDVDVLFYNVLGMRQHRLNVKSVVFALRPAAVGSAVIAGVLITDDRRHRLEFTYQLIKVWQLPPEPLLAGGLATVPLASICAVTESQLPSVIESISRRFESDAKPGKIPDLWAMTHVIMGLRWSVELVDQLLKGATQMRESVTYQAIIEEGFEKGIEEGIEKGIEKGQVTEARSILLRGGIRRMGVPPATITATVNGLGLAALEALNDRLLDGGYATWDELLAGIA